MFTETMEFNLSEFDTLNRGSLEITPTVPLNRGSLEIKPIVPLKTNFSE